MAGMRDDFADAAPMHFQPEGRFSSVHVAMEVAITRNQVGGGRDAYRQE